MNNYQFPIHGLKGPKMDMIHQQTRMFGVLWFEVLSLNHDLFTNVELRVFVDQEMLIKMRGSYLQISFADCLVSSGVQSRFNLRSQSCYSIPEISVLVIVP